MLARIGESARLRVRLARPLRPAAPAHRRRPQAVRLDRRQDQQERRRRPAVRLACSTGAAPRCAAWPASRRSTGSSRCSPRIGVRTRWLPDSNDLEIVPPARLDLAGIDVEAARRTRTVIMFLGPLLHELSDASSCRTPAAATSAPAPSSRTCPRCGPSASTSPPPTASTRPPSSPAVSPTRADRAHRARRHRHRERPAGRRPPRRRRPSSATPAPTTWSRTSASSCEALGVRIDGIGTTTLTVHGRARHRRRRRVLPLRGPDRGDEPARRRRRHRVGRSPSGGCRSSSSRSSWRRSRDGHEVRHHRRVHGSANGHTRLRRPHHHPGPAQRARSTRSTRCRSRASTSTTCRSSRSSRAVRRRARR